MTLLNNLLTNNKKDNSKFDFLNLFTYFITCDLKFLQTIIVINC